MVLAPEAIGAAALAVQHVRAQRTHGMPEPLAAFIPRLSPTYATPHHLAPLLDVLDATRSAPCRVVVSTPPRSGKTETLLHFVAHTLAAHPDRTIGYATYAASLARSKSRRARLLAGRAGVSLAPDMANLDEWRTVAGGGLLAGGVGGQWTGHGVNGLIVDDAVRNRVEAESALMRERTWEWFNDVAYTRLEPGASVVVVMARWHPDDLAGRLIDQGWDEICFPALSDDGAALWPERWPVSELHKIKAQVGAYTWASLYQGQPRPRGGSVFHDAYFYDRLPADGYQEAIGVDLAYSARTHADYSVAILGRLVADRLYLTSVLRHQVQAPQFAAALRELSGGSRVRILALVSGTEKGTIDFLAREPYGVRITGAAATGDKFSRAQPVAAAWNEGRVLVPRPTDAHPVPWLDDFLSEVCGFTGISDIHDDQVDALAALYQVLVRAANGGKSAVV